MNQLDLEVLRMRLLPAQTGEAHGSPGMSQIISRSADAAQDKIDLNQVLAIGITNYTIVENVPCVPALRTPVLSTPCKKPQNHKPSKVINPPALPLLSHLHG